jgi:hypothetical protein
MSNQIPRIPDGYKVVRFGIPKAGDCYVDINGKVMTTESGFLHGNYLIVRKIPPKSRTVKVAKFAMWLDDPEKAWVQTMTQALLDIESPCHFNARRIGPWYEIEILEEVAER